MCGGGTTKKDFDALCSEIEASRNEWDAQASNDVHNSVRGKGGISARHNVSKTKRQTHGNHNSNRRGEQGRGSGGAHEHGGSGFDSYRERLVAGEDAGGRSSCSGGCGRRKGTEGKNQQGGTRKSGNNPRTSPRNGPSVSPLFIEFCDSCIGEEWNASSFPSLCCARFHRSRVSKPSWSVNGVP